MGKAKLIIIGLDGGTFKIIDPLIAQGKLPNLQKLIKEGTRAVLKSTIPPLTAPAWVSLMTGVNPGKHGLFDFKKFGQISYDVPISPNAVETHNLMHSRYYAGKTIWDILSENRMRISVLMMPMTYPAWEINGYMLSGFPSPDFKKPDGYPRWWVSKLGPLFDISVSIHDAHRMVKESQRLTAKLEEILIQQLQDNECDIYSVVFSSTDFLQHYLWKYIGHTQTKYSQAILDAYIQIDNCIGKIMELVNENQCTFTVLSDHGFMDAPRKYFHTNAWLKKEGYLAIKEKKRRSNPIDFLLNPLRYQKAELRMMLKTYFKYLPVNIQKKISGSYYSTDQFIWTKTRAYRYRIGSVEGIAINLKGRQALGTVEPEEYDALRDEIIGKLKEVSDKDNGEKIIAEIYKREEIYNGKFTELAPDIIFMPANGYKGAVGIDTDNIIEYVPQESLETISGVHDMDGILVFNGPKFKKNYRIDSAQIIDIFPTLLYVLGIPIPSYADGRVIRDALRDEFQGEKIAYIDGLTYQGATSDRLSADEEEAMKKSLKGLGYL